MADKYTQEFELGSGAFGHAWVMKEKASGKKVVAKVIKVTKLHGKQIDNCVTELTVLSACKHVNIIRYLDAYLSQGCLNIIMEYARNGDLDKRLEIQKGVPLTKEVILDWFIQIVSALDYIHSKNILHRDLKPKNIFIMEDGTLKLGDFGIARVLCNKNELASTMIGTPYYLSPEICQGKLYNSASDMWAAGCVLYEMCCYRVPFEASNLTELYAKIQQAKYKPIPSLYGTTIPFLLSKLLVPEPTDRLSSLEILQSTQPKPLAGVPNIQEQPRAETNVKQKHGPETGHDQKQHENPSNTIGSRSRAVHGNLDPNLLHTTEPKAELFVKEKQDHETRHDQKQHGNSRYKTLSRSNAVQDDLDPNLLHTADPKAEVNVKEKHDPEPGHHQKQHGNSRYKTLSRSNAVQDDLDPNLLHTADPKAETNVKEKHDPETGHHQKQHGNSRYKTLSRSNAVQDDLDPNLGSHHIDGQHLMKSEAELPSESSHMNVVKSDEENVSKADISETVKADILGTVKADISEIVKADIPETKQADISEIVKADISETGKADMSDEAKMKPSSIEQKEKEIINKHELKIVNEPCSVEKQNYAEKMKDYKGNEEIQNDDRIRRVAGKRTVSSSTDRKHSDGGRLGEKQGLPKHLDAVFRPRCYSDKSPFQKGHTRTFAMSAKGVRRLSSASPIVSRTIALQKKALSIEDPEKLHQNNCLNIRGKLGSDRKSGSVDLLSGTDGEEDSVFTPTTPCSEENNAFTPPAPHSVLSSKAARGADLGSLTYIVEGKDGIDMNNNAEPESGDIHVALITALSVLKISREMSQRFLYDAIICHVGSSRGKELINVVKETVVESGQDYQTLTGLMKPEELKIIPLLALYCY